MASRSSHRPGHGRVLLVRHVDGDLADARRGAGQLAGLRLALAQVAPLGVSGLVAPAAGLGGDVDDARAGHGAERWN